MAQQFKPTSPATPVKSSPPATGAVTASVPQVPQAPPMSSVNPTIPVSAIAAATGVSYSTPAAAVIPTNTLSNADFSSGYRTAIFHAGQNPDQKTMDLVRQQLFDEEEDGGDVLSTVSALSTKSM